MNDQKNMILAIALSALVLVGWQFLVGMPTVEKQKQQQQTQQTPGAPPQPGTSTQPGTTPQPPSQGGATPGQPVSRETALGASPRVQIETPSLAGSIALKGARIDDLSLIKYRETVDPKSPPIVLLSPSGSPHPFYAEFGWSPPPPPQGSEPVKVPGPDTLWQQQGSGALAVGRPVTLTWDNGQGLEFRRTIAVDENYLFTVKDE